jgi:signal transduction histidine kinase
MNYKVISLVARWKRRLMPAAVILLLLVGYVDWITGPQVFMGVFYLVVAYLFTWYGGTTAGLIVALVYGGMWLAGEVVGTKDPSWALLAWNSLVRFTTFAGIVWLVKLSKDLSAEVEALAAAKTQGLSRELQFQKQSEEAIHQLASQLVAAEDAARRKMGQDVHDSVGQNLSVLQLQLEQALKDIPTDADARKRLADALTLLDTVVQQTRTLIFELYPSMLDDLGLMPTLRRYAEYMESQTQTRVTVTESGVPREIASPFRSFLFRAAKELVTNAIKHGKAREALIGIHWRVNDVRVVVDDDGCGMDPALALMPERRKGLGFAWIGERLRSFGGSIRVESIPGQCTRVLLDLPVVDA